LSTVAANGGAPPCFSTYGAGSFYLENVADFGKIVADPVKICANPIEIGLNSGEVGDNLDEKMRPTPAKGGVG
jgi:hypothetical protein